MTGTLYIVATPIGNLGDMTQRLREIFTEVDYILAEDPRMTLKLLQHLSIQKKLYSYSEHSSEQKDQAILSELMEGKKYALVSDAGTPCVSDPGARLIEKVLAQEVTVIPISGPSAVTTLLSVFGRPITSFHFWGFFPIKKKKQRDLIQCFGTVPGVHVFFESPMRILKTLKAYFSDDQNWHMVIGREMTKKFETFYRGKPQEVLEQLERDKVKGEFCVGVIRESIEPHNGT